MGGLRWERQRGGEEEEEGEEKGEDFRSWIPLDSFIGTNTIAVEAFGLNEVI